MKRMIINIDINFYFSLWYHLQSYWCYVQLDNYIDLDVERDPHDPRWMGCEGWQHDPYNYNINPLCKNIGATPIIIDIGAGQCIETLPPVTLDLRFMSFFLDINSQLVYGNIGGLAFPTEGLVANDCIEFTVTNDNVSFNFYSFFTFLYPPSYVICESNCCCNCCC